METQVIDHCRAICRKRLWLDNEVARVNRRDRLTRQEPLNKNTSSMRAKLLLFAGRPGRRRQVAPLTAVTGVLLCAERRRCSPESERQLRRKGGELQDLRHAGARASPSPAYAAQASSASGLTVNAATSLYCVQIKQLNYSSH